MLLAICIIVTILLGSCIFLFGLGAACGELDSKSLGGALLLCGIEASAIMVIWVLYGMIV